MKKKNILLLLLVFVLSFALVACSAPQEKKADQNDAGKAEQKDVNTDTKKQEAKGEATPEQLLKNKNARVAIAKSFDKSFIQDSILANGSLAIDYLVPKNFSVDADGVDFRTKYPEGFLHYNAEEALEAWNKAKEEIGFDTATIELLTSDNDVSKKMAEYLQGQMMTNLPGLKVELNIQPFKQRLALTKSGQFQIVMAGWGPDFADSMTFLDMWENTSTYNEGRYMNDEYSKTIIDAKKGELANKVAERTAALQEAEKILLEDGAIIPLYQRGSAYLWQPYFKDYILKVVSPTEMYKTADTQEVNGKKVLRLQATTDLVTTDHTICTDAPSFILMAQTQEGLVHLDDKGNVLPGVAEKWEVSEDGLEYTFHLRNNAKWADGSPVTANDFVASWRRLADPKVASQYSSMIMTARIKNGDAVVAGEKPVEELGVVAVDEYTLKVTLENPVSYFFTLMSRGNFYPINEKFIESCGGKFGTTAEYSLANGPFKLTNWEIGYGYTVEKNPEYWDAANVKLDGITWRVIKDTAAAVNLYKTGEIDACKLSSEFVDEAIDRPDYKENKEGTVFYLILNINHYDK